MLRPHLIIAFLFCLHTLAACTSVPHAVEPLRLRVLTYNIHHGEGKDGQFDYQRLADIIKRAEPDLVALQEVDVKTRRSKGVDQAATLGSLTGMHHFFGESMPYKDGQYGNMVLSRKPMRAFYRHPLPGEDGLEPRSSAVASVQLWEGRPPIVFGSTHLCHKSAQNRLRQVKSFGGHRAYAGPLTILAGDFNFTSDSKPYHAMIDVGWVDTAAAFGNPKPTVPADQPTMRIDYVFVRPADRWRVIDVQVLDEPIASDHAPLLVELEYIQPE